MKQIVISVPDEWLEGTQPNLYDVMGAVMNGTVLPEHHEDLVDKKEVYKKFYSRCLAEVATEVLSEVTTIIPATREKSCENCANWNEHYGTIDCMGCQNRSLWKPKQTTMKEGENE